MVRYVLILVALFAILTRSTAKIATGDRIQVTGRVTNGVVVSNNQRFKVAGEQLDHYEGGKITLIGNYLGEVINNYGSIKWLDKAEIENFKPDFWYDLRSKLAKYIRYWLPGDIGGLAVGILLGGSTLLSYELKNAFRNVGLSHIVAASGYNLIFVTGWINAITVKLYGKRWAMWFALVGTILYMFISGMSASIVRAGIMNIISITALYFGRKSDPIWSLILTAVIMIIIDPFIISDIGFQLSVAATAGVLLSTSSFGLIILVQALTAPLILHHFGNLSIVAPIANLAVGWTIPLVMQLTTLGLFIGPILFFAWPLLQFTIVVVNWLSKLPFASISVGNMGWGWVIVYYITLAIVYNRFNDRRQDSPIDSSSRWG